jgi:molybdopterin-guanine dinucleotide biosynthesis protein A
MPFASPDALRLLAAELRPGVRAAVASSDGGLEPLLAAYAPEALELLDHAPPDAPLRATIEVLGPAIVEVGSEVVFNVNTPADLAEAERRLLKS